MSSRFARLGIAVSLLLASLQAGPALAQSAAGVWDWEGTAVISARGVSERVPVAGTLTLDVDRTYTLETVGDPLVEVGAWFQDGRRILLFTTNLLALIMALEDESSAALGEPVEVVPLGATGKLTINPKSGLLSVKTSQKMKIFLLGSGTTLPLKASLKATGTRVP